MINSTALGMKQILDLLWEMHDDGDQDDRFTVQQITAMLDKPKYHPVLRDLVALRSMGYMESSERHGRNSLILWRLSQKAIAGNFREVMESGKHPASEYQDMICYKVPAHWGGDVRGDLEQWKVG
jgi:hypothetical protein